MNELNETDTSRTVQTKRWKLHYNEAGEGNVIILLHGSGPGATGWSNFSANIKALSSNFRVIAPDFPGWGKSDVFDCSGESRNAVNAEAVKLLMDELGIEKAALVGNSMGGAAVLQFMTDYPDRISHAVTMGAGIFSLPPMMSPGGLSEGLKVLFGTYANPTPEMFKRMVQVMVFDSSFVTDELAQARSEAALSVKEHLGNFLKWPLGHPDGWFGGVEKLLNGLSLSKVPTMMIHGRDDRVVPLEVSLKTAGAIPNSRVVILNKCGHWAQVEHGDEFNRMVKEFVIHAR